MKVNELITILLAMPQNAEIFHSWDGEARTGINVIWLARNGTVVTSDYGMHCYSTASRPLSAPTSYEEQYWKSPNEEII